MERISLLQVGIEAVLVLVFLLEGKVGDGHLCNSSVACLLAETLELSSRSGWKIRERLEKHSCRGNEE